MLDHMVGIEILIVKFVFTHFGILFLTSITYWLLFISINIGIITLTLIMFSIVCCILSNEFKYFDLLFIKCELDWTVSERYFNFCIDITTFGIINYLCLFIFKFSWIKMRELSSSVCLGIFVLITFHFDIMLHTCLD